MVPEERCKNIRVNPKPVFKEMKRRVCRKPRPAVSAYDRQLLRRLQMWAKSISQEDEVERSHFNVEESRLENKFLIKTENDIDFQP